MGRWAMVILSLLALFFATNSIGYLYGRIVSPDFGNEYDVAAYIVKHASFAYGDGALQGIEVTVGSRSFAYDVQANSVQMALLLNGASSSLFKRGSRAQVERIYKFVGVSKAVPGGAIGAAVMAADHARKQRSWRRAPAYVLRLRRAAGVAMATVAGAVGYLGYKYGYSDTLDPDDPDFIKAMDNPDVWRSVVKPIEGCIAETNKPLPPMTDREEYSMFGAPLTRRPPMAVVATRQNEGQSGDDESSLDELLESVKATNLPIANTKFPQSSSCQTLDGNATRDRPKWVTS